jgi:hypothetical protein
MPKGPKGQKRPADVNAAAVMVAKIATGEIQEDLPDPRRVAAGRRGGPARARSLTPAQRSEIASVAAETRWKKSD